MSCINHMVFYNERLGVVSNKHDQKSDQNLSLLTILFSTRDQMFSATSLHETNRIIKHIYSANTQHYDIDPRYVLTVYDNVLH